MKPPSSDQLAATPIDRGNELGADHDHDHENDRLDEQGQVITTLILTIPVMLLIFMVFFSFTITQSSSAAQISADAVVLHLQTSDLIESLPPDNPDTFIDERKEPFIEMARSGALIQAGRQEAYRRMCPSTRWIVGEACLDYGTNIPTHVIEDDTRDCRTPTNPEGQAQVGDQRHWPDVKVWISFTNYPVPVDECLSNPLDNVREGTEEWDRMMEVPLEEWRVVVFITLRPVVPSLMTFIVNQPDRIAVSCGPIFLAGADPDLWKC